MKKIDIVSALLWVFCLSLTAQEEKTEIIKTGWNFGALPTITYNSDLGFQYGVLTNFYNYGDGSTYPGYKHSIYAEVSRYTKGSGIYRLFYDSKYVVPGIRVTVDLSYLTEQALNFYGFNGYDAIYHKEYEDQDKAAYISRMYYKHARNTFRFKLDLQGKIGDSELGWVGGYSLLNTDISSVNINKLNEGLDAEDLLPDTASLYDKYIDWGIIGQDEADGSLQHNIKTGLVYDTRDNEPCPMKGLWTEVVLFNSFGPEFSFGKLGIIHRQYFTLIPEDLSLAYRLSYQGQIWGDMPFYMAPYMVYSYIRSSNSDGLGGSKTIRGMVRNRLVAKSMAFANVELRWKFTYFQFLKQNCYVALNPFMDFGRTISPYELDFSGVVDENQAIDQSALDSHFDEGAEKLHATYGMGLHFAMNHNFVVAADIGLPMNEQDGDLGVYIGMNWLF